MENLARLAPVGVCVLISFLAYGSQILFLYVEPYSLKTRQKVIFNFLVACIYICYARACLLDPGRVPSRCNSPSLVEETNSENSCSRRTRWCKRCGNFKPPRSHHCKTCERCVPKMDHHCPWTINCVSHRTLPSFMRFLYYATMSMTYLEYFLYQRLAIIWVGRDLPSYLGPSPTQLIFLFVFAIANSLTLFFVGAMFIRSTWSLSANTTTIEGWEIDRHEVLLRRAKVLGGYLEGPDGARIRICRQEFPYDIGIWSNIVQGMNGGPMSWFLPFATAPPVHSGLSFEVNGFEDASTIWPPPDPDRISRKPEAGPAFTFDNNRETNEERVTSFRERQAADHARHRGSPVPYRRQVFHQRFRDDDDINDGSESGEDDVDSNVGEESWRGSEGERLADFGLDEDAEFYDEDEVPLSRLIASKRPKSQ